MLKLTEHILALNTKKTGYGILSSTQLRVVLYYTMKLALVNHLLPLKQLKALYDEPFLLWRYGPTVKSVYEKYCRFPDTFARGSYHSDLTPLDGIITALLEMETFGLLSLIRDEPFYKQHEHEVHQWRSNFAYSLEDIKGE